MNSIAHPAPAVSLTPYDRCECGHPSADHREGSAECHAVGFPALGSEDDRPCRCQAFDAALPKAHGEIQAACQRLLEQVEDFATVLRDVIADPIRAPELLNDEYGPCQSGLGRYGVLEHGNQHGLDWALARLEEALPESEAQP